MKALKERLTPVRTAGFDSNLGECNLFVSLHTHSYKCTHTQAKSKEREAPSTPERAISEATKIANFTPTRKPPSQAPPVPPLPPVDDSETVRRSGNPSKKSKSSSKDKKSKSKDSNSSKPPNLTVEEQLVAAKEQVSVEKAGKRKLFHSLVKLANELRKTRSESTPLLEQARYADKNWYEGGMWRAPEILPGVSAVGQQELLPQSPNTEKSKVPVRIRPAISLSDLFFNLVIVTAFTRVGVAISQQSSSALLADDSISSLLYFAVFWTVWSKEASYSTRFDTTDLSATMETLATCFCVLFASLSVQAPINSTDGTRIMMMAAFVAGLHCLLHIRVALSTRTGSGTASGGESPASSSSEPSAVSLPSADNALAKHVLHYAMFNVVMTALEMIVWCIGIFVLDVDYEYRWAIYVGGILLALRVPRAFLANDFHGTYCW
jgi:hypothetical protein